MPHGGREVIMSLFNEADGGDKRIVTGANGYSRSNYWTYPDAVRAFYQRHKLIECVIHADQLRLN